MLALQLIEGRPELILEGSRGSLKLQVDTVLKSGTWHTLHLHLDAKVCMTALLSAHVCYDEHELSGKIHDFQLSFLSLAVYHEYAMLLSK